MILVSPSILSCDFTRLKDEIKNVSDCGADWIHMDVMDGHFVPNITIGMPVVESVKRVSQLPLDVHLMISDPLFFAPLFIKAGADLLTFHVESKSNVSDVLNALTKSNVKIGLTLKPKTPAKSVYPYLKYIDMVLVMTVEPGFGGQEFMHGMLPKITEIREKCLSLGVSPYIQVDGGINNKTAAFAVEAGADVLVAGTAIFKSDNYKKAINELKGCNDSMKQQSVL
jgi:ribulose-phosphate 3-epimerase